jgi:hypothetical protein
VNRKPSKELLSLLDAGILLGAIALDSDFKIKSCPQPLLDAGVRVGDDFREYTCRHRLEGLKGLLALEDGTVRDYDVPLYVYGEVYKIQASAKLDKDSGHVIIVLRHSSRYLAGYRSRQVFDWLNQARELEKITTCFANHTLIVAVGDKLQYERLWESRLRLMGTDVWHLYIVLIRRVESSEGIRKEYVVLGEEVVGGYSLVQSKHSGDNRMPLPKLEEQNSQYARVNAQLLNQEEGVLHFYKADSMIHLAAQVDFHPHQLNRPLNQFTGKPLAEGGLDDSIWIPRRSLIEEAIATKKKVTITREHRWNRIKWTLFESAELVDYGEVKVTVGQPDWQKQAWNNYIG